MHSPRSPTPASASPGPSIPRARGLFAFARRRPFLCFFLLILASNLAGSFFNITYNQQLIVARYLDQSQKEVFQWVALPAYNLLAYPIPVAVGIWLVRPLRACRRRLLAGEGVEPGQLERCRQRLINMPFHAMWLTVLGWLPGAVFFPLVICGLGGTNQAGRIWVDFGVSFTVAALFTTVQTFAVLETFTIEVLYPDFFRGARPADVPGVVRISFRTRLALLWLAVALMPLAALLLVALDLGGGAGDSEELRALAWNVFVAGAASGGLIFWFIGRDVLSWIERHESATEQIAHGNLDVHIDELRPDEWGRLTDRFNDMAGALRRARADYETFGQIVSPKVRDAIVERYPGLGGEVKEITVLFADIRGFTRRSAGEPPERVVELLNRFLTLAVRAVEGKGGEVNKFLGDGLMALFNAEPPCPAHADQALAAAREMVARLDKLNSELIAQGQEGLRVGIGIHTGPALVGCIGASIPLGEGGERLRREFTVIGETVNLGARVEQLTKEHGGPILLSEATYQRLERPAGLTALGPVAVPGYDGMMVVYRVTEG